MCEETAMRPRAICPSSLDDKQLRKLYQIDKRLIVSAWRTSEGFIVYVDGPDSNCYFWKKRVWVRVEDKA
jgi:hypothetical protein